MLAGDEIKPHLKDEKEDGLGHFRPKLFRGAEDRVTELMIHRSVQDAVDDHKDNDKHLEDPKIWFPKRTALCIVFQ